MSTKRLYMMLLVMLMSVTGAWAVVRGVSYTTIYSEFTKLSEYEDGVWLYDNFKSNRNSAVVIVQPETPVNLCSVVITTVWGEATPNRIQIEGISNFNSEWTLLHDGTIAFPGRTMAEVPVTTDDDYLYFRITFYSSSAPFWIRGIELYQNIFDGDGTPTNPYILDGATYVKKFAEYVAVRNNNACAKLIKDLDLSGTALTPIDNANFVGTIDGDGHTLKNISNACGLFKNIGAATIKNLIIENATLTETGVSSGALAAQANGTTFQNCGVKGTISANGSNVGGLVGNAVGCTFNQCFSATNVNNDGAAHLPVFGSGNATMTHSYYYGTGSEAAISKADVSSGRLTYLLNGSVDYGTGPYYQKIGTDRYPVLTGNNYVYRSLDGNSYTNSCPHHNKGLVASFKPLTCVTNGNVAYYRCPNPVCKKYLFENNGVTTAKETAISFKPVIVSNHSWHSSVGLGYTTNINRDGTNYYNVTTLVVYGNVVVNGDYIVTYTHLNDESALTFHEFCTTNYDWQNPQTVRYYVNGVERTALSHTLEPNSDETHKRIVVDNLKQYDIIKIVYHCYLSSNSASPQTRLYIAQENPTGWTGAHHFRTVESTYNCLEGGYVAHYECDVCEQAFNSNSNADNDKNLVPLSTLYHDPLPAGHAFALSDQTTEDGLLKYTCQNAYCTSVEPNHFAIKDCLGTQTVSVTFDGTRYTADEASQTMTDAVAYRSPVAFDVESLTYSRTFYPEVWNPWLVPFDMSVSELTENGVTDVATIESIHNYDTDFDGVVDKTVLEVIRKKAGTLKGNLPYMVKTGVSYTYPMVFSEGKTLKASTDIVPMRSETSSAAYDFIGTYSGLTAEEVNAASIFSLNSNGAMVHRTGTILPQRWYMKEVAKENVYEELSPAMARAISIRVIGEEDETTGIRTIYPEDEQKEELLPEGIFDLNGRKLSAPQPGKINIINGKKQFVR